MINYTTHNIIKQCNGMLERNTTFQKLTGRKKVEFRKRFTNIRLQRRGLKTL